MYNICMYKPVINITQNNLLNSRRHKLNDLNGIILLIFKINEVDIIKCSKHCYCLHVSTDFIYQMLTIYLVDILDPID
jgi:hypothetical protein